MRRTGVLTMAGCLMALAVIATGCSAADDDPGRTATGASTAAAGSSATAGGTAGTGGTAAGAAGTLVIRVRVGEQCPHEPATPDPSCSPVPLPATDVTVLDAAGDVVAEGESGGSGTLQLAVPPGDYTVRGADLADYQLTPSQPASVTAGEAVEVLLTYGNGIQ